MPERILKRRVSLCLVILLLFFTQRSFAQNSLFPFTNKGSRVEADASLEKINTAPGGVSRIAVKVSIAPGHHAYLDRGEKGFYIPVEFDFSTLGPLSIQVTPVSSPKGEEDEEFGATVLRGEGIFKFDMSGKEGVDFASVPGFKLSYQVCNDETKICYPPASMNISMPGATGAEATAGATAVATGGGGGTSPKKASPKKRVKQQTGENVSEVVSRKFSEYSQNFFLSFILILAAGLLAAGTPCVYPMLPITCTILMNRGKGDKRLGTCHTLAYFAGIVLVYIFLGYLAGMTGGAFNTFMRSALVNLFFSLIFILFGLAMLGFFQMSVGENFIASLSNAAGKRESLSGTLLMGATAGLIISPCVGPVVFTLLMSVADKIAEANALAASSGEELSYLKKMLISGKGGLLMGGFGIGIGTPFLLVGFFSSKMPRSGTWMNYIKYIFGIIIFYVAWIYYMKGMHTAKIPENSSYVIMTAILLLILAVKLGAFRSEDRVYKKIASLLLLITSIGFGYSGLLKSGLTSIPAAGNSAVEEFESHGNLRWHRNYITAKEMAEAENTPMFLDFYADWCANCAEFGKLSLSNKKLNSALKKVILVKIYDTDPVFKTFQNRPEHRELKTGLPYFTLLSPDEKMLWEGTQYNAVDTMVSAIELSLSSSN